MEVNCTDPSPSVSFPWIVTYPFQVDKTWLHVFAARLAFIVIFEVFYLNYSIF
jgi:hypothetical protein